MDAAPARFAFTVAEGGARLDRYLAERPELQEAHLSRSRIKALIEDGRVTLNGAPLRDASKKLAEGAEIVVEVPPPAPAEPQAEDIDLTIVFEDDHLVVIDKPKGLVVHRIDKDTTGLLVVAKTDAAHHGLSKLFADHGRSLSLTREYLAFVWGVPDRAHGTIETYLGRHSIQREKMAVVSEARGREAITHWEKVADYGLASLIRCQLETGRTHQIRVHLAHVGHPLIGDATYGAGFKTKVAKLPVAARAAVEKLGRQALHAATLGFEHPITGEEMMFESELPEDLAALQAALEEM